MHTSLTVNTCVTIRKGCPMTWHLGSDNQAEFSFGGQRDGFDFVFDAEALRELLTLGTKALGELDARRAEEAAEDHGSEPARVANAR